MGSTIHTVSHDMYGGTIIDIECHLSNGLPGVVIVGLGSKSIDESKERVRSAFSESQLELPKKRITLNLAPADIPKDGSSYDLPMAASILKASGQAKSIKTEGLVIIGELGLDGSVRPIRGIIGKILSAAQKGYGTFIIPSGNLEQASLVPNISLIPVNSLRDYYMHATGTVPIKHIDSHFSISTVPEVNHSNDYADIVGQSRAKRALEIAAAGGHNILLNGPPGTGKSMLAKALPGILPQMSLEEILEVTQLHSLASRQFDEIINTRPFRSPHHSSSNISILGGGQHPKPGEISLSHRGVLLFDELPEYNRSTLEALRQPLEDKIITVARAKDTVTYPADSIFVSTANPCPCGHYGSSKPCSCTIPEILRYQKKLSGPILDRIDLFIDVDDVEHASLLSNEKSEPSKDIRFRVEKARSIQNNRFKKTSFLNANMTNRHIKTYAKLTHEAENILNDAATKMNVSARGYMKIIKVARTIADIESHDLIGIADITEALQYRRRN